MEPRDVQRELRKLIRYASSNEPSRAVIAERLRVLGALIHTGSGLKRKWYARSDKEYRSGGDPGSIYEGVIFKRKRTDPMWIAGYQACSGVARIPHDTHEFAVPEEAMLASEHAIQKMLRDELASWT